jgi:tRNA-specific 2-thiouridylase
MKIAVAMSGGVDSSVAAHILKARGHDVFGLTMKVWPCGSGDDVDPRVCCGPAAVRDAERVARTIGIPHYTVGLASRFEDVVVEHFVSEYARGRTPNPCARCNRLVKFDTLLAKARSLGASRLATGHHAVVRVDPASGLRSLARGTDRDKDQTYFLYGLTQLELAHVIMPVGEITKGEVREAAGRAGLHVADRPESQDACFVPRGDLESFLRERSPGALEPGPIVDLEGSVLGEHGGIALYTVGQRSGLGLSRPEPTYVVRIVARENTIVVGGEADLYSSRLAASGLTWVAGSPPGESFRAEAKIRYAAPPAACRVDLAGGEASVTFDEPLRAIAPGQAVVFYDGDTVLGGGTIESQPTLRIVRRR